MLIEPAAHRVSAHYGDDGVDQAQEEVLPEGNVHPEHGQDYQVRHVVDAEADHGIDPGFDQGATAGLAHTG